MSAPNYSAADFTRALQNLLPRGLVWPNAPDSVLAQLLAALAPTWSRHTQRDNYLLQDAFPATAVELLPEWEAALGLPDPCAGESPTLQGRQAQVVARLTGVGGQSIPYFIAYALLLGYTITVTEYSPFRMGCMAMGHALGSADWSHTWAVNAPLHTVTPFRMGLSGMGEPLESWGNVVLECELNEVKPAHTLLNFIYS